jgi:hypothetical protein
MNTMSLRTSLTLFATLMIACDDDRDADGNNGGDATVADAFFLPTGEPDNTSAPTIELDAAGNIHAVYPAYAGGDAYYAFCAAGCADSDDVSVVRFATDGTVANAMLALDAEGRPQVLLSSYATVDYATCDGDCTDPAAWTTTQLIKHDGEREVTGEAFALDPAGRPRFLMHTYVAFLGIGQAAPETHYVACDDDCNDPASWTQHLVAEQIWQSSHLRFDANGTAHVATVATVQGQDGAASQDIAAYVACESDCTDGMQWIGNPLTPAFSSMYEAVDMRPAISLALTKAGEPRVAVIGQDDAGVRNVAYLACDTDCATAPWIGTSLSQGDDIGPGIDLALDANDNPRFTYTFAYNIGLASCDADECQHADSPWTLTGVELGEDLDTDEIFLWPNCNVGAWFFHSPSLALDANGDARVGYQARDISGGWSNPDPTMPDCEAGTDMTWSRIALLR